MGSSKRSKEKDREGRRKHHRDDSSDEERERSSRKERKREKSQERDRSRERDRNRGRDRSRERERVRERSRERERGKEREKEPGRRERERDRRKDDSDRRRRHSSSSEEEEKEDERRKSRRRREREEPSDTRRVEKDSSRGAERHHKRPDSPSPSGSDEEQPSRHRQRKLQERGESPPERRRRGRREGGEREVSNEAKEEEEEEVGPLLKGSGGDVSLSIEETNKLRAKLGLKPLEVEGSKREGEEGAEVEETSKKKDVHVPAKNIRDIKTAEKLRSKMETMKETRRLAKKLSSVRGLGEEDREVEGASEWVTRMRQLQKEKDQAAKRAQLLAEMDEEFGVGDLVSESFQEEKRRAYSSHNLQGLKVEHNLEDFREEKNIILTIKDAGVLEEGDDLLVNVNMVDDEKSKKNVEAKKGKPLYNPFEQEEEGEFGEVKKPSLLKKYDEEIEGEKRHSFALGEGGDVDTSEQREKQLVREKLKASGISLQVAPSQVATEYYTAEEMVQFRKPRKKRKVRKRLKADDLLPLADEQTSKDHGSRDHGSRRQRRDMTDDEKMETGTESEQTKDDAALADEMDSEVDSALLRNRRLLKREKTETSGAAKVASMLQSVPHKMEEEEGKEEDSGEVIVLDTTAEFCRQLGEEEEEPYRRSSTTHYDEEHGEGDMELDTSTQETAGGWMEVQPTSQKAAEPQVEDLYQEAEPIVASGITAALQLANKKGFIEEGKKKREPGETTVVYSDAQRDREYERQKERERERELSRYDRESTFPEKREYRPNVKIEYVDDDGRVLSTKEAFRFMSHKFHGRGSGKRKQERRIKKIQDEHFMNKSSSVDTPLNTLTVLRAKQLASQTPYLLLSGGAQSMLAPDIAKKK